MPLSPRLLVPRASGAFLPTRVSGLAIWLDAADTSTFTLNSGNVAEWRDKSGNNRNATQSTAASQPLRANWGDGRLVPNTADLAQRSMILQNSLSVTRNVAGITASCVIRCGISSANQPVLQFQSGANNARFSVRVNNTVSSSTRLALLARRLDSDTVNAVGGGASLTEGQSFTSVVTCVADYANSDGFIFENGDLLASNTSFGTSGNTENTDSTSANLMGIGSFFFGLVAEVVVYNRVLSSSERTVLDRYLGRKWGITVA